jgi:hypothetical protein
MSNLEFILNPSVRPVYITATNMILPIINISLYSIKKFILFNQNYKFNRFDTFFDLFADEYNNIPVYIESFDVYGKYSKENIHYMNYKIKQIL